MSSRRRRSPTLTREYSTQNFFQRMMNKSLCCCCMSLFRKEKVYSGNSCTSDTSRQDTPRDPPKPRKYSREPVQRTNKNKTSNWISWITSMNK